MSVFAIFSDFSVSESILERSLSVFAFLVIIFCVIFTFFDDFRDFDRFGLGFEAFLEYLCDFYVNFYMLFVDFSDFDDFCKGPVQDFS